MTNRPDETWHRLQQWTSGQAPSERLAAQILLSENYQNVDPSHPLGGPDGGMDALCRKDGVRWIMAAYFPRGQKSFRCAPLALPALEDEAIAWQVFCHGFHPIPHTRNGSK